MAVLRKFVDEILVDGALFHKLDCGHVHHAQNTEPYSQPAGEQDCEHCQLEETVEQLLKRTGKSEGN